VFRGLNFLLFVFALLLLGCGDKLNSLKIISSELSSSRSDFKFNKDFQYIKLQINSNPFSYLALGYSDYDENGFITTVWYSSDKHVLRVKFDRLHSISAASKLWYGMNYFSLPNSNFSINSSYKRVRFGRDDLEKEVFEKVYVSDTNNAPNSFKKFCGIGDAGIYISEISVDQYGNNLKSYYGLIINDTLKKIKCVYQELDNKNIVKWVFI
jgi:hypothetical protein